MHEKPTSSLIAYEAYLRGLQASRQATELVVGPLSDRLEGEAVRCFETAIREDPQFSAVYAALATHLVARMGFNHPNKDDLPRIRALVDKALELDPGSGDAHLAQANLAMQGDLDWARAEAEFQEAIALNPSNSSAHNWYGYLLIALQRFEEARKQFLAATELDPLWLTPRLNLTVVEMQNGDVNSSLAAREAVWKSHDENLVARSLLAWGYAYASRAGDAVKLVEPLKGATDLDSRCIRSEILAVSGRPGELRDLLSDTLNGRVAGYVSQATLALFHALLGEDERALALLEQDCRKGDRTLWAFYQSVSFDRIREDPRFVALLSAMKLPTTLSRRWRLSV